MRALITTKDDGGTRTVLDAVDDEALPEGDVTVAVDYSTLNYKDALAITGRGPVVRRFPMVPGIDFSGTVMDSRHPDWRAGDAVILNGWGLGETRWGALAERARVRGEWLVRRPESFTARRAMAVGTAGYTAMLSIMALEAHGLAPERGDVVVTGATGGVGSVAVHLLSRLGYRVAAVTGRPEHGDYLRDLGASDVLERAAFAAPGKPLEPERWAGAIDAVGGQTLAGVCAAMRRDGVVAACGLAGGMEFPATVAPFILRGVTLCGIDSVYRERATRERAWARLAETLDFGKLDAMTTEIGLGEAIGAAQGLLAGRSHGRIVIDVRR